MKYSWQCVYISLSESRFIIKTSVQNKRHEGIFSPLNPELYISNVDIKARAELRREMAKQPIFHRFNGEGDTKNAIVLHTLL